MQKLKKALKKLANFGQSTESKGPAKAAKKASTVKRKTQAVSTSGAKTAKAGAAAKKAASAKKAATAKAKTATKAAAKAAEAKETKKKAPAKAAAPAKAPEKAAEKAAAPAKAAKKTSAAAKATPVVKAPAVKAPKKEEERPLPAVTTAPQPVEEVVLTDAEGRRYCRVKDCDQIANVEAYCRYHYLLYWKNIQNRKKILSEGKLERYIEELTARYPDKYLEILRKDLRSEKDFMAAIQELEIDDSSVDTEFEDETQSYLDEVRGMSSEAGAERDDEF